MLEFTFNGEIIDIERNNNTYILPYPCLNDQTHCSPYFCLLPAGSFLFEVIGGSGGTSDSNYVGYGGISEGILSLEEPTDSFFYVGSEGIFLTGSTGFTGTAFNGGGEGYNGLSSRVASSGGGSSDIRLINNSLHNRVIVAGGGGGTGYHSSKGFMHGGNGGSNEGTKGIDYSSSNSGGEPGTQYSGGLSSQSQPSGDFGIGASKTGSNGCGGGGGWSGGGSGGPNSASGGGGSGFVYSSQHSMNHLPSSYFLKNSSTKYQTDTQGHGIIRVTVLNSNLNAQMHSSNFSNSLFAFLLTKFLIPFLSFEMKF